MRDGIWLWISNVALTVLVVSAVAEPGGPITDGLSLFGLGLVFGMDVAQWRRS